MNKWTCRLAIKRQDGATWSDRGNEIEGSVYLPRLNGQGVSVHESDTARLWVFFVVFFCFLTMVVHARVRCHQPLCRWLIRRAPPPPFPLGEALWRAGPAAVSASAGRQLSPAGAAHGLHTGFAAAAAAACMSVLVLAGRVSSLIRW